MNFNAQTHTYIESDFTNPMFSVLTWTDHFMQEELLPLVQSKNLTLVFSSESSVEEELKRESTADIITILVRWEIFSPLFFLVNIYIGLHNSLIELVRWGHLLFQ